MDSVWASGDFEGKKIIIGTNVFTHDAMVTKVTFKNLCVPLANQDDEYYILF